MTTPLISVIIPVYNTERYIADAIRSVFATAYPALDVIVVDDGSTDGTSTVLSSFGDTVRVIHQSNQGQSVARNVGIREARGKLIAFLDADDLWTADHLELLLKLLSLHPECFLARGNIQYVRSVDGVLGERTGSLFMHSLVGACLYRKEVFERIGTFDENMRSGEDGDWNLRFEESGLPECRTDAVVLLYRRHESNMTNSREVMIQGQLEAARKRIERLRKKELS